MIKKILTAILLLPTLLYAQINTERVMTIARNGHHPFRIDLCIQQYGTGDDHCSECIVF